MKTRSIAALSLFTSMLSLAGLVTATMQPIAMPIAGSGNWRWPVRASTTTDRNWP